MNESESVSQSVCHFSILNKRSRPDNVFYLLLLNPLLGFNWALKGPLNTVPANQNTIKWFQKLLQFPVLGRDSSFKILLSVDILINVFVHNKLGICKIGVVSRQRREICKKKLEIISLTWPHNFTHGEASKVGWTGKCLMGKSFTTWRSLAPCCEPTLTPLCSATRNLQVSIEERHLPERLVSILDCGNYEALVPVHSGYFWFLFCCQDTAEVIRHSVPRRIPIQVQSLGNQSRISGN